MIRLALEVVPKQSQVGLVEKSSKRFFLNRSHHLGCNVYADTGSSSTAFNILLRIKAYPDNCE